MRLSLAAAVLLDPRGRTLVSCATNGDGALFSRLWQFPAVAAGRNPRQALSEHIERSLGVQAATIETLASARHTVTFREIRLLPFLVRVERLPALPGARTPLLNELDTLPVSSATQKIAASALRAVQAARDARGACFALPAGVPRRPMLD